MADKLIITGSNKDNLYKGSQKINNLITEFNTAVIEGDSSLEAAQARVDSDGFTYTTLKERLDTQHNNVNSKLKNIAIDIKSLGAKGDGITDDSQAFIDAHTKAISENTEVYFPSGKYILENVDQTLITSMSGNDAEIYIKGNVALNYDSNMRIDRVNIVSDYTVDSTLSPGTLLIALNDTSNITLKNMEYIIDTTVLDGTVRGKSLTRTKSQNVNIFNFKSKNSRLPIIIESNTTNPVKNVTIKNYFTENAQTGLYLAGKTDARVENIDIDNIRLINTTQQKANYSQLNGADLILGEYTKNVNIRNVYSENPCERAIYINVVDGMKIDNVSLNDSDGVKVVGVVDKANSRYEYSNNISVSNVLHTNGFEGRTLTFYDVKNVNIDNIRSFNDISKAVDAVVLFERTVENVKLNNVNGRNSRRGIVRFNAVIDSNFDTYFKDIFIDGIKFMNPTTRTSGYTAISFPITGTPTSYLFENINIDNVYVENQVVSDAESGGKLFVYSANANLKGLIEVDRIDGLKISNSFAYGINDINGGVIVGLNSNKIDIETEIVALNSDFAPTGLYASPYSKIKCIRYDSGKSSNFVNIITPIGIGFYDVVDVKNSHKGELEGSISLNDEVSQIIPYTNGMVEVTSDNGEYITAHISSTIATKINGSTNSVVTDTDGKLCVYVSGGQLYIKNRMATTLKLNVSYKYINK